MKVCDYKYPCLPLCRPDCTGQHGPAFPHSHIFSILILKSSKTVYCCFTHESTITEEMSVVACPRCTSRVTDVIIADADTCFLSPHKKCEETAIRPERFSHLTQGEMGIRDGLLQGFLSWLPDSWTALIAADLWH